MTYRHRRHNRTLIPATATSCDAAPTDCSMLFLATNPRRGWCTANICGNRAHVIATTTAAPTPPASPAV
ncbi:CGNR zinc finger domain-containing protein [Mycobacterium kiyosense]